jgi:predicted DNA-binding ArsR family transcriptional regulator
LELGVVVGDEVRGAEVSVVALDAVIELATDDDDEREEDVEVIESTVLELLSVVLEVTYESDVDSAVVCELEVLSVVLESTDEVVVEST